ncbi:quinone oxidoreductase family protein [Tabrizicola sp.]|uniref:quinone oxidoreductase family protein n=1 Tax=Tabrizicola sp. TaxID=2005166 RepID=UPI003F4019F9
MPDRTVSAMRAVVLDRFGGFENLELREVPRPVPEDGQVLVRVHAAGVGSWDAEEREGGYDGIFGMPSTFPYILGWDGTGVAEAVGRNVGKLKVGDRVYAASMPLPSGGFYAEYAVVDQEHVSPVPSNLSLEQAAAMPWDALTAQSGIDALRLSPGRSVMILGASGGIGHLAVQFAKLHGARVLAVASGADGVDLSRRLGADVAIDGRQDDVLAAAAAFSSKGIDAALTTFGGEAADRAIAAVRAGGIVACPHGVAPTPEPAAAVSLVMYNGDRSQQAFDRLNRLVETDQVRVEVSEVFRLDQAQQAHARIERHYVGKLVLRVV